MEVHRAVRDLLHQGAVCCHPGARVLEIQTAKGKGWTAREEVLFLALLNPESLERLAVYKDLHFWNFKDKAKTPRRGRGPLQLSQGGTGGV